MRRWQKLLGVVALAVFFTVQLAQTLLGTYAWPFTPYALFWWNRNPSVGRLEATLRLDDGGERRVAASELAPLEFFLTEELLWERFVLSEDDADQQALLGALLRNLNEHPWVQFDEIPAAPRAPRGRRFVGLALELRTYDVTDFPTTRRLTALRTVPLAQVAERGALP